MVKMKVRRRHHGNNENRNSTNEGGPDSQGRSRLDRKSTRLNSSHGYISYAVFCLKKKKDFQDLNEARVAGGRQEHLTAHLADGGGATCGDVAPSAVHVPRKHPIGSHILHPHRSTV